MWPVHVHAPHAYSRSVSNASLFACGVCVWLQDGDTALICASRNGHAEVVKALLAANANVEAKNNVRLPCVCVCADDAC